MTNSAPQPLSDTPATLLGPTWDLLDSLPRATTPPSMTSTTLEMVAAATRPQPRPGSLWQGWLAPAAIVAATEPLLQPSSGERARLLEGYGRLRCQLGEPGVTRRAAAAILDQLPAVVA